MSKSDTDARDTITDTIVRADPNRINKPSDHGDQFRIVQQRNWSHGQQLLESVQHEHVCGRSELQRDWGVLRSGIGKQHATGNGAFVYEQWSSIPEWDDDADCDNDNQRDSGTEWNGSKHTNHGDSASGNVGTGDGALYSRRPDGREPVVCGIECGTGNGAKLPECGRMRNYNSDNDRSARIPEHAHCV